MRAVWWNVIEAKRRKFYDQGAFETVGKSGGKYSNVANALKILYSTYRILDIINANIVWSVICVRIIVSKKALVMRSYVYAYI